MFYKKIIKDLNKYSLKINNPDLKLEYKKYKL